MVDARQLGRLSNLVREAVEEQYVQDAVRALKHKVLNGEELFLWKVLPKQLFDEDLPDGILSGWIFVLKPNIQTPAHSHPNSVQHSIILEGNGKIVIAGKEPEINVSDAKIQQSWHIIPKGVPHKVITGNSPVVVFSFHTCKANELIEVETSSGRSRFYEKR